MNPALARLSREQLIELLDIYSKNWLAMDGLWFLAAEKDYGLAKAMDFDCRVWEQYTEIEAQRLKSFLKLPERGGLEGLAEALRLRFYANLNRDEITVRDGVLTYRALDCRVQRAREKKGLPFHPCRPVGLVEYGRFAKVIDDRLNCVCLSCFPEITDESCCCAWQFTLT